MPLLEYLLERRDRPEVIDSFIYRAQLIDADGEITYSLYLLSGGQKETYDQRSNKKIESDLRIKESKKP